MPISTNIQMIRSAIPKEVCLIAVSKTFTADRVRDAYQAGQRDFGENKVQELYTKAEALKDLHDIRWHFIGHLQSNKVNALLQVPNLYMMHSVDREKIARLLSDRLASAGRELKILVQVNTSAEESKYGCKPDECQKLVTEITKMPSLNFCGYMTIGKLGGSELETSRCFSKLKEISLRTKSLETCELSMGMTLDYKLAIDQGSTMIRVGRAIFGDRSLPDSYYWPES